MFKYIFVNKFIYFGILAIIFAFINLLMAFHKKDYKIYMFLSLSFTIFTICGFIVDASFKFKDIATLEDVNGYAHGLLWVLTVLSMLINSIPMIIEYLNNKRR